MKQSWLLLASLYATQASQHSFSVHDDVLAHPQFEVTFPISYVTEQYANSRLANKKARSSDTRSTNHQPASGDEASAISSGDKGGEGEEENGVAKYERMILNDRPYLCAIPTARAEQASNATAPTSSPDDEKQELIRATDRGWELLQAMQGSCIYYVSGWWSYSFCYNNEVKQFHQLPPSRMVPVYPPQEDPSVQSYVLGSYPSKKDGSWEEGDKKSAVELAKLETKGENRYLVQKIAGGTLCDLTDKERRIEIQFHCHPQSGDRIGLIKEVATCVYLMVIYTPRLCNDVAFLPPQGTESNQIKCVEIVKEADVPAWHAARETAAEDLRLQDYTQAPQIVGGVEVGAKKAVGSKGRVIEKSAIVGGGAEKYIDTVASSEGGTMDEKEMKKLNIHNVKDIEKIKKDVEKVAGERGWKLNVVDTPRGRELRGVIVPDDKTEKKAGDEHDEDSDSDNAGSEEVFKDEL